MLRLHRHEVTDDHQNRRGGQRKRDAGRDGEAENEPRRVRVRHHSGMREPAGDYLTVDTTAPADQAVEQVLAYLGDVAR